MAAVSVSSDTAGAGLFLEVIVRHVPGLMGSEVRCLWLLPRGVRDITARRSLQR
ncbi:hypothetical protein D3C81_1731960 [compost metagenome]